MLTNTDDNNLIKNAKCLYVSLNDEFFKNLVITYSPYMEDYKKSTLEEVVRNMSFSGIGFQDSVLKNTIR